MDLCNIDAVKLLLSRHGFTLSKGLGQNFLCDDEVPINIAERAGIDTDTCVLEVGPGIGALTTHLCDKAKTVVAVELDKRLPDILKETMAHAENFTLISGDIMKTDIKALCHEHFGENKTVACANLPYYITTPVISLLIESGCFSAITVMVQREVAARICATPGTKSYGAFTVYVNYFCDPKIVLDVNRDKFIPSPKVDSSVVRLDVRGCPPVKIDNERMFFRTVKAAFAQRRKTLQNCLASGFSQLDKQAIASILQSCGIPENARGETLGIPEFAKLSSVLNNIVNT